MDEHFNERYAVVRLLLHAQDDDLFDSAVDLASLADVGQEEADCDNVLRLRVLQLSCNLL